MWECTWSGRGATLHVSCALNVCIELVNPVLRMKAVFYCPADRNSLLNMLNNPFLLFGVFSQIDLTYFVKFIFIWHEENRYGRTVNLSESLCVTFCLLKRRKSVIPGNKFLNYYKGFNVFCMKNPLLKVCLLHKEIFQHLQQFCHGSPVIETRSVHSCFPSSTDLVWTENGYLFSFEQSTLLALCWLLGTTIKPDGSRLTNQFRGFLSDLKQQRL